MPFFLVLLHNSDMDQKLLAFQKLASTFKSHGYHLYLVGGTVRDYLVGKELDDMDAVSDATPKEIESFLPNVETAFAYLGSLKYKSEEGIKFDITTLRKESGYLDNRHPSQITFVKDLSIDYLRRDFTVNALYMDANLKVIDYCRGQDDLKNHLLRMVGDPDIRIEEDPLRILRAIRFHLMLNLKIDDALLKAMHNNFSLLKNITDAKIRSELNKIKDEQVNAEMKKDIFAQFDIANLQGVIK